MEWKTYLSKKRGRHLQESTYSKSKNPAEIKVSIILDNIRIYVVVALIKECAELRSQKPGGQALGWTLI
jgi:hypothetical protein